MASGQSLRLTYLSIQYMAGAGYERINHFKNKALKESESGVVMKGGHTFYYRFLEDIADKNNEIQEGTVSEQWDGRSASVIHQFIMSSLMCKTEAELVETNATYGENTILSMLWSLMWLQLSGQK